MLIYLALYVKDVLTSEGKLGLDLLAKDLPINIVNQELERLP